MWGTICKVPIKRRYGTPQEWHISYPRCHMSYVIPYLSPIRWPYTYNVSQIVPGITCRISHVIITYHIVHIALHMSRITYTCHASYVLYHFLPNIARCFFFYHALRITQVFYYVYSSAVTRDTSQPLLCVSVLCDLLVCLYVTLNFGVGAGQALGLGCF
jgi:hypothetical protein